MTSWRSQKFPVTEKIEHSDNDVPGQESRPALHQAPPAQFDAIIIGAGIAGVYQLYRLRQLGLSVTVLEAGSGVGGTWYWNRYPGARLDSESYTYGYFFSEELQNEWSWSEEFVSQPELQRYFDFVADKFDLRRNIQLDSRVVSATYNKKAGRWDVHTADGRAMRCRYLVTAVGILSAPQFPSAPGLEDFKGEWHHTALWPAEPVALSGKKVAIIGTGSSGIQIISAIAHEVAELTVFQRTPNWCAPLNNKPLSPKRALEIRRTYRDIYRACLESPNGFKHVPRDQSAMDVSPKERRAYYEQLWKDSGLRFYVKNFRDILTSKEANDTVSQFLSEKIRERVKDPTVAEKLIPKDHGFAMKRPPLETNYYEVFNLDHVTLVDMSEEPIRRFTATGIQTPTKSYDVDFIVLATGFDAITGALNRIHIRGVRGNLLRDYWAEGPRTYLGLLSHGFPNMFMINGPLSPTGNNPRTTEFQVDLVTECIRYMSERRLSSVEPTTEAEDQWAEGVNKMVEGTLLKDANSWAFGSNVPGKKRVFLQYAGGVRDYREQCSAIVKDGYKGLEFDHVAAADTAVRAEAS